MRYAYIKGTGKCVPQKILKNDWFECVGSNDEWIYKNLGIRERRIAEDETTVDLAFGAAQKALDDAQIQAEELDLIIVATSTPERLAPSSACMVQERLGAKNAFCFDLSAVCSGALFALSTASQYIQTAMCNNVLVVGADVFSKITDWSRRDSVFFGDGAGAIVLSATTEKRGFLDFKLHSDGKGKDGFMIPNLFGNTKDKTYFNMDGKAVFDTATQMLPKVIQEVLTAQGLSTKDVKCVVPHQPSINILKKTAEVLGMDFSKFKTNMERYANTSGGTVPILLDEVRKSNEFKPNDYIIFAAVGSGWTWGAALYKV